MKNDVLNFFFGKNMIFQLLFIILWYFLLNSLLLIAVGHQHNPSTDLVRPEEP
jgi:hypothetical protein